MAAAAAKQDDDGFGDGSLKIRMLKVDAVPTIFSVYPSYMQPVAIQPRSTAALSSNRFENQSRKYEMEVDEFVFGPKVETRDEVKKLMTAEYLRGFQDKERPFPVGLPAQISLVDHRVGLFRNNGEAEC